MRFASNTIAITVSTVLVGVTCALAWNEVSPLVSAPASSVSSVDGALLIDAPIASEPAPMAREEVSVQLPDATVETVPSAMLLPAAAPGTVSMVAPAAGSVTASPVVPVVTLAVVTVPVVTVPKATVPVVTVPVVATTVPRVVATLPPVTAPPATSPAPTTTAASRQRYSVTGVPVPSSFVIPRTWTKPIPDWPAGCVAGQLEDNGVWNCQR